jgi:threonine dehydrogenase-like Zn-dependent dehydrogenase
MEILPKDLVLVSGCGPVGLGAVVIAKHYNARVIAVEVSPYRKKLAGELGADYVLDGSSASLEQNILDATGGQRPNKTVETSGVHSLQEFVLRMSAKLGHVGFVGHNNTPVNLVPSELIFRGLTVYGSWHVNLNDITGKIYDILRRSPRAARLITHVFTFEQAQEAFDTFLSGESGKIIFHPWT